MHLATLLLALQPAQTFETQGAALAQVGSVGSEYDADDRLDAVVARAGTLYAAGTAESPWGSRWLVIARSVADGSTAWTVEFELSPGGSGNNARDIDIAADGSVLVAVGALSDGDPVDLDAAALALDPLDGSLLWERRFDEAGLGDELCAVALSPDGERVAVAGHVDSGTAHAERFLVACLDATDGSVLWDWRFDGNPGALSEDAASDLLWSSDGTTIIATGLTSLLGHGGVYGTFALEAQLGGLLWSHFYTESFLTKSAPVALATNGAQVVVVGRHIASSDNEDLNGTLALDANTGAYLWSTSGMAGFGTTGSQAVATDGEDFFVAESAAFSFFDAKWVATRLDGATGTREWEDVYTTPLSPLAKLQPTAAAYDAASDRLLIGGQYDANQLSAADPIVSVDAAYDGTTGARLWLETTSGAGSPDDSTADVAIAGASAIGVGQRFVATLGYGLTYRSRSLGSGQVLWSEVEQRDAAGANTPYAIALDAASGDLFTAGAVQGGAKVVPQIARVDGGTGGLLWTYDDDPGTVSGGRFIAAAPSADGNRLFGVGTTGEDFLVVALDAATGTLLWRREVDGQTEGKGDALGLALSADGAVVFVSGTINGTVGVFGSTDDRAMLTMALDAATGTDLWSQIHDPTVLDERGELVVLSPDGSTLFATGTRDVDASTVQDLDVEVVAYDSATGAPLWTATHGVGDVKIGTWVDRPLAVQTSADGTTLAIAGFSRRTLDEPRATLWRLDATDGSRLGLETVLLGTKSVTGLGGVISADRTRAVTVGTFSASAGGVAAGFDLVLDQPLWVATYPPTFGTFLDGVTMAPDGRTAYLAGGGTDDRFLTLAVDVESGAELWRAEYEPPGDVGSIQVSDERSAVYDSTRRRLWVAGAGSLAGADLDGLLLGYDDPSLLGEALDLSLSLGGTQDLTARAGAAFAGDVYLLLGSLAGTAPGVGLAPDVLLPLNPDSYTTLTLSQPGSAFLPGSLGVLDAAGGADLALVIPPGTNPAVAGLTVHHAYVALDLGSPGLSIVFASNAIAADLVP